MGKSFFLVKNIYILEIGASFRSIVRMQANSTFLCPCYINWRGIDFIQRQRSPKYPDFKHKDTGEALWIEGRYNPPWVKSQLAILDSRMGYHHYQENGMHVNFMSSDEALPFWQLEKDKRMFSNAVIVMYNLLCIVLVINSFYNIIREVLKFSIAFPLQLFIVLLSGRRVVQYWYNCCIIGVLEMT